MTKTKLSMLGSVTNGLYTLLSGLFNLIVIRQIIQVYGSDFNGLNSTAMQFINMLLIIEGGFALAANVALFEPLSNDDRPQINGILSAVKLYFNKIGIIFSCVGLISVFVFAALVKSDLPYYVKYLTFLMLVVSTAFNLFYSTKYKILFQSDQQEYFLNLLSISFLITTNLLTLFAILLHLPMLILRVIVMICSIGNSLLIGIACRKRYPFIDLHVKPACENIRGTGDVFAQKITGVLYYAMPILFVASFNGTASASVYAVYNTVFTLIRSLEHSIINSPRMSIGRLIAEEGIKSEHLQAVFNEYEHCMFIATTCMLSVTTVMIMPFVRIYTAGISDVSYINWTMAIILSIICFLECIHIPSGNLINMAGWFRIGRNIQIIAGILLLVFLIIAGILRSLNAILLAVLLTAAILAFLEIGFVRNKLFPNSIFFFFKSFFINVVTGLVLVIVELKIPIIIYNINNFITFFVYSGVLLVVNFVVIFFVNMVFNRKLTVNVLQRFTFIVRAFLKIQSSN